MPRNADGSVNGGQCLAGVLDLYDVAGKIRVQLGDLIAAEKARGD